MKNFNQIKKNLKKDFSSFKDIRVAVLGDSSTQFLAQTIKGIGFDRKINLTIWEADFNQIERQVMDPVSELYEFRPEFVILFFSSQKLLEKYNKSNLIEQAKIADTEMRSIKDLTNQIHYQSGAKIIIYNYSEIDDAIFGSFSNKLPSSFLFQLRKLNYYLMSYASEISNLFICDLSSVQNQIGKASFFQPSIYVTTEMILSIDALPLIGSRTLDIICAIKGDFKKCIILDLDNTTWGGVIGDDGIENIQVGSLGIGKAFTEFQYWVKKLKSRGIIVSVCSKNTESVALEPFEKHPEMVLQLDDISVFVANWDNKADNIRHIQSILNIGFDSMVFIDDNPFERNIVRENLPEVTVPEMPEDPAEYLEYLYKLNLFETVSHSKLDADRTKLYQIESNRLKTQKKFTKVEDFLKTLEMYSTVSKFTKFNIPRVAQLSQRSNQFNLRTIRYTEDDIKKIAISEEYISRCFTLEDKFGDNGLISVVILRKEENKTLFIDTWFMSCRVLKRGMEAFVLKTIVNLSKEKGFRILKGEYIPSLKNGMVKNHYKELGFAAKKGFWELNLKTYKKKNSFIEISKTK